MAFIALVIRRTIATTVYACQKHVHWVDGLARRQIKPMIADASLSRYRGQRLLPPSSYPYCKCCCLLLLLLLQPSTNCLAKSTIHRPRKCLRDHPKTRNNVSKCHSLDNNVKCICFLVLGPVRGPNSR
jgi:hypothetical protein